MQVLWTKNIKIFLYGPRRAAAGFVCWLIQKNGFVRVGIEIFYIKIMKVTFALTGVCVCVRSLPLDLAVCLGFDAYFDIYLCFSSVFFSLLFGITVVNVNFLRIFFCLRANK